MAHIASCLQPAAERDRLSTSSQIVRPLSPLPLSSEVDLQGPTPWVWRMAQSESRKYQLFPKEKQVAASPVKGLAPDQAFALAMGQNLDRTDNMHTSGSLRLRIREHNNLPVPTRRRKVSVPELGPMTTVHESSMDSPTLPSRPTLHERSISAPGNGWKHVNTTYQTTADARNEASGSTVTRPPPSPKDLPPLMIPGQMSALPSLKRQLSLSRLRSGSASSEPSTRAAKPDDSPRSKAPYTPACTPSSASTWYSASTASTLPTPVSATHDSRPSKTEATRPETPGDLSTERSARDLTPVSAVEPRSASSVGHRRNVSDTASLSGSIMDRGRPKKKTENGLGRSCSKKSKSAERRAFERLPKGWKAADAINMLDSTETTALHKQALQQAERFEILRKSDVDSLSRELRNLDERCEYLRRTYHSLRAGRRNLHSRICQYLRSPRTVKFSQESLLKQEEALAELDTSIDDWVNKLEHAENRRTRVRQKLLEHVAAAVTIPIHGPGGPFTMDVRSPTAPAEPATPPRSPTNKGAAAVQTAAPSASPSRVVAQIPSTIVEQPLVEEAAAVGLGIDQSATADEPCTAGIRRTEVESIRIYAGDEVAALLADVEQQITRMSKASEANAALRERDSASREKESFNLSEQQRKELHRAQSQEALQGGQNNESSSSLDTGSGPVKESPTTSTSQSAASSVTDTKEDVSSQFILSAAVFNPQTAVAQ